MKKLSSSFTKLIALAACALSLGSCSRAEYAMLPQGGSYHGTTRPATTVSTSVATAATPAVEAAPAPIAATPAAVTPTPVAAKSSSSATVAAAPAPKLSLVQRVAMNKVARKVDKLIQKSGSVRKHENTASTSETSAISGNLRTGLIFLLVGLLVGLFSGISPIFGLIAAIFAIIGLVFIILWLLDQA